MESTPLRDAIDPVLVQLRPDVRDMALQMFMCGAYTLDREMQKASKTGDPARLARAMDAMTAEIEEVLGVVYERRG